MNWLDLSREFDKISTDNNIQTHMDIGYKDNIPSVDKFVLPGTIIDLREKAVSGEIGPETIDLSKVSPDCAVVLRTGWEEYFGEEKYVDSPDINYDLVDKLIDKGAKLLLVDSPGIYGGARGEEHNEMDLHIVSRGAVAVEHLCNLNKLPQKFTIYCFPLNVRQLNWLPARVVASWK